MRKLLMIFVFGLLCFNHSYSEEFPEEEILKELGVGVKKVDLNYLCKNAQNVSDEIEIAFKKYKYNSKEILLSVEYDDEFELYSYPINVVTKYNNLKSFNERFAKNEVLIKYDIFPEIYPLLDKENNIFYQKIFLNPKNLDLPYYYFENIYILKPDEFEKFGNFHNITWFMDIDSSLEEEIFVDHKYDNFIKILINNQAEFHKFVSKILGYNDPPTLEDLIEPKNKKSRLIALDRLALKIMPLEEIMKDFYQCGKK